MNHYKILMVWGFINIALGVIIILWPQFPFVVFGYIAYSIAIVMFIYAAVFFGYRNHIPGQKVDVEDAEVVELDENDKV
jgi:cbb3-type cytochrome oxidase subunit 3